ncbi:MAG TPA: hypothetical protein VMU76_10260 [Acidimicrobiales bacterium]|nr:hypothetical protein [Acidimicrobiales bacterium]
MTPGRGGRLPGTRPFVLTVSGSEIRRFVGLPEEGFPTGTGWARPAGRRLAVHPLLANPRPDGLDVVLDVLEQARPLLVAVGVRFDVIRIRRGCAVVRALPLGDLSSGAACELSRGLLETVPAMARGIRGTVVETTCRERGAEACLYTALWDATVGVMTLYRPFARHGPWPPQTGTAATFVLEPDLAPPWQSPPGSSLPAEQPPHPPPSDREPDSRGGT